MQNKQKTLSYDKVFYFMRVLTVLLLYDTMIVTILFWERVLWEKAKGY